MSTTLTIAKREFRSNFDSPLAYVVICLSLIALGFVFFFAGGGFWQADRATLGQLFVWAPRGLAWFITPVVTMRLLAEERKSGTLEMLITLPVKDHEVILGKFLGAWGMVLVLIGATLVYPLVMFGGSTWMAAAIGGGGVLLILLLLSGVQKFVEKIVDNLLYAAGAAALGAAMTYFGWHLGVLDRGPVIAGYVGLVVYSAAAISLGLLISALTESQVISFFITLTLLLFLHLIGQAHDSITSYPKVREVIAFISFDTRLAPFARGMINTRDIVFFLSITVGCLMAAFRALERRKWT
jgi:ABC-2 type transport system permease protein